MTKGIILRIMPTEELHLPTRKIKQSVESGFSENKSGTCVLSNLIAPDMHAHYKGQAFFLSHSIGQAGTCMDKMCPS